MMYCNLFERNSRHSNNESGKNINFKSNNMLSFGQQMNIWNKTWWKFFKHLTTTLVHNENQDVLTCDISLHLKEISL